MRNRRSALSKPPQGNSDHLQVARLPIATSKYLKFLPTFVPEVPHTTALHLQLITMVRITTILERGEMNSNCFKSSRGYGDGRKGKMENKKEKQA